MALSHGAEKMAASVELLPRRQALVTVENNEIVIAGVSKKKKSAGGYYVVVVSLSRVRLFATPQAAARQASLSSTVSLSLLRLMSIESVMPSSHL